MSRLSAICAALLGISVVAAADSAAVAASTDLEAEIAADEEVLERSRRLVEDGRSVDVPELEDELRALRKRSRDRHAESLSDLRALERDRDLLGPPPAAGAPPEIDALAARRNDINAALARIQGQRTRLQANMDEAAEILGALAQRRLALLYRSLGERGPPLYSGALWGEAAAGAAAAGSGLARHLASWTGDQRKQGDFGAAVSAGILAAAAVLAMLIIGPAHGGVRNRIARRFAGASPGPDRRGALAGAQMIARLILGLIAGALLLLAARVTGFLPADRMDIALSVLTALLAVYFVGDLSAGSSTPAGGPGPEAAPARQRQAVTANRLLLAIVIVFGLRVLIVGAAEAAAAPGLGGLAEGLAAIIIGLLFVLLCRPALWRRDDPPAGEQDAAHGRGWSLLRPAGRWLGAAIAIAAIAGYGRLADFAASRLYYFLLAFALAFALRTTLREIAAWAGRRLAGAGPRLAPGESDPNFRFWSGLAIDTLLIGALTPVILVLAGVSASRLGDMAAQAFFGIRIGTVTFSLAQIAAAVGLFVAGLAATRVVQRGLARGPFAHSRLDIGVQNSLTTLVGYVGLALAALIGVTALGVNLANFAIIAGALSVGIGFGLQSVVNNFVSGLILLFERPIKVGDWVVTASGEGTVRKISVRSTEIDTFERSTIIVPNSELIAQTVTNWTHRNRLGRVAVRVGVAYSSDPEAVRAILLQCANDHPEVLRFPEAFVVWMDFGASSLDFELRAFIADISRGLQVRTDLRFAIFKAFREAGVEIPFPQQDVYIKGLPDGAAQPARRSERPAAAGVAPPNEPEDAGALAEDD